MSVENALLYLKMLNEDRDFSEAITNISDDKAEQMRIINERGLDFTKEEFKRALVDCVQENCDFNATNGKRKLDDSELDSVNAAGIFGNILIAITGAGLVAAVTEGSKALVGTIGDIVDGKPIGTALEEGFAEGINNTDNKVDELMKCIPF